MARSPDELDQTAGQVRDLGASALVVPADVSGPGQLTAAVRRIRGEPGDVDVLINNAAVVWPPGASTSIDPAQWAAAININVVAVADLSFVLLPAMIAGKRGRTVNISSGIAANPAGMLRANADATSKAALEAHTINLAAGLAGAGVTVNAFRPGSVDTAMQAWIRGQEPDLTGAELHHRFTSPTSKEPDQPATVRPAAARLPGHRRHRAHLDRLRSRLAISYDTFEYLETAMTLLHPGDQFPALPLTPPGGDTLALPDALAGGFGVVLFYRGSWCPYCNAQLRAFQRAAGSLAEVGAKVVALSVDDEATTLDLIAKHGLTFPVGHSADARAIAQATGAFIHEDPLYLQSTGFILDPAGHVVVSVYSSGAIGRLVPEDVIGMIRYLREHAAPATSA